MAPMDIKFVNIKAVCGDMDASAGIAANRERERASATPGLATDIGLFYAACCAPC